MKKNGPSLWPFRLQPIRFDEGGESITKLIFPIVASNLQPAPDFSYSETQGTPAKFREVARVLGLPDEMFVNFATIHNPELRFIAPPGAGIKFPSR